MSGLDRANAQVAVQQIRVVELIAEVERVAAERDEAREQLAAAVHPSWREAALRDGAEVKRLRAVIDELASLNVKAVALAVEGAK